MSKLLEVELGQDFNPFEGMERLKKGKYIGILGRSNEFHLERIGKGDLYLARLDTTFTSAAQVLKIADNQEGELIPLDQLYTIGSLESQINILEAKTSPSIFLTVNMPGIELISRNENKGSQRDLTAIFYMFHKPQSRKEINLIIAPDLPFLQKLSFRFDQK